MGTSRRYAHHYDRRMGEKFLERVLAEFAPCSLRDEELQLGVEPLTRPPRAMPVTAWVRYGSGETAVRVEGWAVAGRRGLWSGCRRRVRCIGRGCGRQRLAGCELHERAISGSDRTGAERR